MEEQKRSKILELEGLRGFRASGNKIGNHFFKKIKTFLLNLLLSMSKDG